MKEKNQQGTRVKGENRNDYCDSHNSLKTYKMCDYKTKIFGILQFCDRVS